MKVGLIVSSLAKKGPVIAMGALAERLRRRGHSVTIFYFDDLRDLELAVDTRRISFLWPIDFRKFDVVHACGIRPDAYVAIWSRFWRFRSITTLQNYMYDDLRMIYGALLAKAATMLWRSFISRHTAAVVLSSHMKDYYDPALRGVEVVVIPNGLSFVRIPQDQPRPDELTFLYDTIRSRNRFIVGSVGAMIRRKGFEVVVDLLTRHPDTAVVLIGDGPERTRIESIAQSVGVADRLFLLGFVDNISDHLCKWDLYISPAHSEGFSLAMMEAMSLGLPILATSLPIYREFERINAILCFRRDDPSSLDKAISTIQNAEVDYGAASKAAYWAHFSEENMVNAYESLYAQIAAGANRVDGLSTH